MKEKGFCLERGVNGTDLSMKERNKGNYQPTNLWKIDIDCIGSNYPITEYKKFYIS
jgi:hypothetical protein